MNNYYCVMVDGAEDGIWIFTKIEEIKKWRDKELIEEEELIITKGILFGEKLKTRHRYSCVIFDKETFIFETEEEAEKEYANEEILDGFYVK